jgi:ribosomal protein L37E
MPSKELRRRLQAADPDLNIVPRHFRSQSKQSEVNWEKAGGIICRNCGREVFRSRDGLCMPCWEKAHEIEIVDKTGITNWLPMDIINQITHLAKKA